MLICDDFFKITKQDINMLRNITTKLAQTLRQTKSNQYQGFFSTTVRPGNTINKEEKTQTHTQQTTANQQPQPTKTFADLVKETYGIEIPSKNRSADRCRPGGPGT
jgi:hypothetical protein